MKDINKKRNYIILILTSIIIFSLASTVFFAIRDVNKKNRQFCFDDLAETCKNLARQLNNTTVSDRNLLKVIATNLSLKEDVKREDVVDSMKAFGYENSYITYLQALMPDNTILNTDGTAINANGILDFKKEMQKGMYISQKTEGIPDSTDFVVRNAVPVIKDKETICILYGVISLKQFAKLYTTDIYDGNAYVYLEDGGTGDFLLDTWHKSLGNINGFSERETLKGYDFNNVINDLHSNIPGNIAFISKTTGSAMYLHYEPTKINNWNAIVSVTEEDAFKRTQSIGRILYRMSLIIGIILIMYIAAIVFIMLSNNRIIQKLSNEDSVTMTQNRNAYENYVEKVRNDVFERASCIYIDANGLHEVNNKYGHAEGDKLLLTIADSIKKEFLYSNIYRIGGDEFVILCTDMSSEMCKSKIKLIEKNVEKAGYTISSGFSSRENEKGLDRIVLEADTNMVNQKKKFYEEMEIRNPR